MTMALPVRQKAMVKSFQDISTNHYLIHESISNEGVCRTAPATPGLLTRGHTTNSVLTDEIHPPSLMSRELYCIGRKYTN